MYCYVIVYKGLYIITFGPFTFFNVQKTKYLQVISFAMRIIGKFEKYCFIEFLLFINGRAI